ALHKVVWGLVSAAFYGSTPVAEIFALIEDLRPMAVTPIALGQLERPLPSLLAMTGRFDEVQPAIDRVMGLFEETGRPTARPSATLYTGPAARLAGDLEGAEDQLRKAIHVLWDEWHNSSLGCSLMTELARTLFDAGRYDEAERWAHQARDITTSDDIYAQSDWRAIVAKVSGRRGESESAIRLAREAVAISDPSDYLDFRAVWRRDLAEALVRSEERRVGKEGRWRGVRRPD